MRVLRRAVDACLARPRWTLGLFLLLTAAWTPALTRLELETDGRALLPPDHPALALQAAVDEGYATSDFLVVGLAAREGEIFTPEALGWVLAASEEIEALPGVAAGELRSLSTVFTPSWTPGGLRLEPPLRDEVATAAEAAAVAAEAAADPLLHRVLYSADRRGVALYVPLAAGADRRRVVRRVEEVAAAELAAAESAAGGTAAEARHTLHLLGPAAAESLLGEHVLRDLGTLLPLALGVVVLVLWLWFGQTSVVLVGLGEAAAVVVWTLGLLGALGKGISLVTVVMPVILATYCVADTIHIAQRFREKCRERPPGEGSPGDRRAALGEALDEVMKPVVLTSLTTCAGFFSFGFSPIPPLADFGLASGFGILCALAVSLLVVPPALLVTGFGRGRERAGLQAPAVRLLEGAMLGAARRPAPVIAVTLGLCLLSAVGLSRLRIQDSWVDNFAADSPLVRSDRWFNDNFYGSNVVNLVVDGGAPGAVLEPGMLAALEELEARLEALPPVGGALTLADQLTAVGRTLEGQARLPRDRPEAEEWSLLVRMAGGNASLDPYLSADAGAANLWLFLNRGDYRKTAEVLRAVAGFPWPGGLQPQLGFAGDAYLGYLVVGLIATSLRLSLLGALGVNLLVVWWMLRSARGAVLVILPVALAVLWNFGFMGWSGLALGVATSTFSAIALGIGIDFALHWWAKLQLVLAAGGGWQEALRRTAASAGGAILLNGAVLLLGFGVLLFSTAPPNQRLGVLIGVNLLACLGATLVLLPAVATLLVRPRARRAALAAPAERWEAPW